MQSKEHSGAPAPEEEAVVIFDSSRNVTLWNAAARRIFGAQLAAGATLETLLAKDAAQRAVLQFDRALNAAAAGAQQQQSGELYLDDLKLYARFSVLSSAKDRQSVMLLVSASKATLPELEQQLDRAVKEAEQFSYLASHDLQEPVRQIGSFCSLLNDRYRESLDEDAKTYLGFAVDGAQRLQALLNDLLVYSRVSRAPLEIKTISSQSAFERARQQVEPEIAETKAAITASPLPEVRADDTQLTRVFYLLLHNALKFHGEHPPAITLGAEREGAYWKFFVRDSGIGFKPEFNEHIFAPFKRLHGRTKYPGTGMGLAICKKLIERLGGRIWAESEEGAGAAFFFTLPFD